MPEISLKNQRVLVTGGGGKLGDELVQAFSNAGAHVAVHFHQNKTECHSERSEESTAPSVSRRSFAFAQDDNNGNSFQADIRDIGQIKKTVHAAAKSLGGLDILINNAAIFGRTPIEDVTLEQWNDFIDINLRAPFFLAKFSAPYLASGCPTSVGGISPAKAGHPKGRIINIADTYGASPSAGFVPYGVSKAGLIAMTKGLAKELAPDVLVNCVCPNVISYQVDKLSSCQVEEINKRAIDNTLLKRPVAIDDVIKTILFLAENNSMTGQAIFVDCGRTLSF